MRDLVFQHAQTTEEIANVSPCATGWMNIYFESAVGEGYDGLVVRPCIDTLYYRVFVHIVSIGHIR